MDRVLSMRRITHIHTHTQAEREREREQRESRERERERDTEREKQRPNRYLLRKFHDPPSRGLQITAMQVGWKGVALFC